MFVSFKSGNTLNSLNSSSTYRLHPELQTRLIITLLPNGAGYQQSEYVYHENVHVCMHVHACVYTVMCMKAGSILLLLRNKQTSPELYFFPHSATFFARAPNDACCYGYYHLNI